MIEFQNSYVFNLFKNYLITAQFLALLPVSGARSLQDIHFKWKSFPVFYCIATMLVSFILILFEIFHYSVNGLTNDRKLNSFLGKLANFALSVQYFRTARKWPKLMTQWSKVDVIMNRRYGRLNHLRFKICFAIFIITSMGVYISYFRSFIKTDNILRYCHVYSYIFNYIPYNAGLGFIFLIHFTIQFSVRIFNDFFIIVLCMLLALRLKQIRIRLELSEKNAERNFTNKFWLQIRLDYDRLYHLCKELDNCINGLILLSFGYNMFFLISYLFAHLMIEHSASTSITSWYFFIFLLLRIFAVCLYTSWVHDEGWGPVNVLNSVPSRDYNPEIGRWLVQLSFDDVAVTGGKIFKITRGIFLSVVSVVVTYELVAMQFRGFSTKI